jgi:hypothetical protein
MRNRWHSRKRCLSISGSQRSAILLTIKIHPSLSKLPDISDQSMRSLFTALYILWPLMEPQVSEDQRLIKTELASTYQTADHRVVKYQHKGQSKAKQTKQSKQSKIVNICSLVRLFLFIHLYQTVFFEYTSSERSEYDTNDSSIRCQGRVTNRHF